MKRFLSLFLLLSYLISSPGLVYSMHFCGQTLTDVSVAKEAACCCPLPKKPTGCCHDQKVASTIKDVKLTSAQLKLPVSAVVPTPLRLAYRLPVPTYPAEAPPASLAAAAAPPPNCPAYVRGHAFLI